jgi:two-component system CheB/CheR fusion protein
MFLQVIVNYDLDILQFRGTTLFAALFGKASFNILKMAHPEITFELCIHNAIKPNKRL